MLKKLTCRITKCTLQTKTQKTVVNQPTPASLPLAKSWSLASRNSGGMSPQKQLVVAASTHTLIVIFLFLAGQHLPLKK